VRIPAKKAIQTEVLVRSVVLLIVIGVRNYHRWHAQDLSENVVGQRTSQGRDNGFGAPAVAHRLYHGFADL